MKRFPLSTILSLSVLSVLLLSGAFLISVASASQHPIVRSHGVVFSTGNKHQAETDLRLENSVQTLVLKRYYNSQSTRLGVFGYGWSGGIPEFSALSVDGDLIVQTFAKGRKKLYADDGSGNWVSKAGDKETITATATGYEYIELTGSVNQYDADGKLLDITDKNGNQLIFAYAGDKLSTISDSVGRTITFSYTGDLITTITTPIGDYIYGYDANDNLTSVGKPDGTSRTYLYDDPNDVHNLTGIFDEGNDRIQTVGYDDSDRVISSSLKGGSEALTFAYTGGLERQVTDSRGVTTTYRITVNGGVGRVASITGPGCTSCGGAGANSRYSYNDRALLVQATDGNGHKTSYEYDDSGNRTTLVEADSSLLRRVTTYTYETDSNRLATITRDSAAYSGKSVVTTYTYDANHNPETIVTDGYDGTTAISRTIAYDYDSLGRITLVDGPRTDVTDTVSFAYYPNSSDQGNNRANLNSVTNALGHVVTYQDYNLLGQPQTIILPTTTVTLTYDDLGRMTSRTVGGLTTSFGYDLAGSLESITLPGDRVITYDYDTAGYLERITDNKGNYISFSYDTNGNRTDEDIYDQSGLLHGYADFGYDDYGRLETTTLADGSRQTRGYDEVGNLVSVINGMSQTSTYDYDTLDRLTTITEPGSVISRFGYDRHNYLLSVTDAEARATTYLHDDFGRRVERTSADTGTTGFTYDESGNITSVTDANGDTIEYRYDALNRPSGTDLPGTANYYSFTYDQGTNGIGHLSQITDPHGSQSYSYDSLGRVTGETRVTGSTTASTFYNYDPVTGDLSTLTYPSGLALTYQRDENGAVTGITANGQPLLQNGTYLPFGPVESYQFGNGQQLVKSFDQRYQLTDIQASGLNYHYTRDFNSRIKTIAGLIPPDPEAASSTFSYETDTSRLDASAGTLTKDYTLDANGNTVSDGSRTFVYNALNQLVRIEEGSTEVAGYQYDVYFRRISKTVDGTTTLFQYDLAGRLIGESAEDGTPLRDYVWFNSQPCALIVYQDGSSSTYYYINDHLGTPQQLVTGDGSVVWRAGYHPYGLAEVMVEQVVNNLRFPGQYYDAESGLHYNRHRYYDAETGRYVTADLIGFAGGLNLYSYVGGDPVNWVDPEGLKGIAIDFGGDYGIGSGGEVTPNGVIHQGGGAGSGFYIGAKDGGYAELGAYTYESFMTNSGKTPGGTIGPGVNITVYHTDAEKFFPGKVKYKSWTYIFVSGTRYFDPCTGETIGRSISIGGKGLGWVVGEEGTSDGLQFRLQ